MTTREEESNALAIRQIKDLHQDNPIPPGWGVLRAGERPERQQNTSSGIVDQEGGSPSGAGRQSPVGGPATAEHVGGHTDRQVPKERQP